MKYEWLYNLIAILVIIGTVFVFAHDFAALKNMEYQPAVGELLRVEYNSQNDLYAYYRIKNSASYPPYLVEAFYFIPESYSVIIYPGDDVTGVCVYFEQAQPIDTILPDVIRHNRLLDINYCEGGK